MHFPTSSCSATFAILLGQFAPPPLDFVRSSRLGAERSVLVDLVSRFTEFTMRLALFINNHKTSISQDREDSARTVAPRCMPMANTIVADLQAPQTDHDQGENPKERRLPNRVKPARRSRHREGLRPRRPGKTVNTIPLLCKWKRKVPCLGMIWPASQTIAPAAAIQEFRHR